VPENVIALFAPIGLVALVVVTALTVITRYKVAKPNQAFIVTGRKGKTSGDLSGQKVVTGGGVFVVPFVQQLSVLDLSSQKIEVSVRDAVSAQGIKLNVDGIAIVKVGGDEESIRLAAQRLTGVPSQQLKIIEDTTHVLSGVLRSIVGTLTVEQIIRDRANFAAQVAEQIETSLTVQGLTLDTFQIADVKDDGSYLADMGRPEAARVKQEAAIAEADARRTAEQRRLAAEQDILDAQREFELRNAEVTAETEAAKATAAAAGPLAAAARQQEVLTAEERVAEKQAALTERQLDTQVRKPADAARYQAQQEADAARYTVEQEAEAARRREILAAEAEAERSRLTGEGEKAKRAALADAGLVEAQKAADAAAASGEGERAKRAALAEAIRLEGEAQGAAALAVGSAEAEAMDKKAAAFKNYGEAAIAQMLVEVLPKVAHELAAPISAIDSMTVISNEGASALPRTVSANLVQLNQVVKDAIGLDLSALASTVTGGTAETVVSTAADAARANGSEHPVSSSVERG